MERSQKSAWLEGPGDLKEADVEDVPVKGQSVRVRGLPAAYSNQAQSEALEMKTIGNAQIATVNSARLEVLQFQHGVIDPTFSREEAEQVAQRFGPAFKKVIAKIDELSGVDKEAIENAEARFPGGGDEPDREGETGTNGASSGSARPPVPARAG
jgi:hypothetical protein